jgi:hypothetical protein
MKLTKPVLLSLTLATALLGASAICPAQAFQHHERSMAHGRDFAGAHGINGAHGGWSRPHWYGYGGIYVGGWPWYAPWYYGYAWPVYPYADVAVPAPTQYVEMGQAPAGAPANAAPAAWYYCANPAGYYPYVKDCPGGWRQVEPQAPQPAPAQ